MSGGGGRLFLFLAVAFALRLAFGLAFDFWGDDEFQIYLIGLKFYTTGVWPLYGPDVVYTETRIPGGMLGLLVGGPFWILPWPEAPYILLNILSLAALALLAWYIGRRLPDVPRWFLWPWVFFSPWTLDISAHIINTSYAILGAIVFGVSAFELVPALRARVLPRSVAWFGLGFGVSWVAQFHLSVAILIPLAAIVCVLAARDEPRSAAAGLGWCVLGAALPALTLVPTLVAHGVGAVAGRTGENVVFEPVNLLRMPQIVVQFLSLASFEVARFMGPSTQDRLAFLARFAWAAPAVIVAAVLGLLQVGVLLVELFRRHPERRHWTPVRLATLGVLALLVPSFMFSVRAPASHAYYVLLPVVVIYAFHVWADLLRLRWVRTAAAVLLVTGGITHVALAIRNFTDRSMYSDRARVVRAIQERNYRVLGERRTEFWAPERRGEE
jgi:hypothetical protein